MDKTDVGRQNVEWSLHLLAHLAALGVKHVIISPGSRSTPLVLAVNAISSFEKHVILDERSAAFFAIGIGKLTGKPAVLICTSGTAAANYFPAVIEASQSYTPLIVISADRPGNLQNRHAPQTINQEHLFGKYAVLYRNSENFLKNFTSEDTANLASELYHTSIQERGPVHLNAPFSKPLEPTEHILKNMLAKTDFNEFQTEQHNVSYEDSEKVAQLLKPVLEKLAQKFRPLIIAGPSTVRQGTEQLLLKALAENGTYPILAESVSGAKCNQFTANMNAVITGFETFLRNTTTAESLKPDFILRIGLPPISKALTQFLLQNKDTEQWSVSHAKQVPDPDYTVSQFIKVPFHSRQFEMECPDAEGDKNWLLQWKQKENEAKTALHRVIREAKNFTDGNAIHQIIKQLPENATMFISNSLSVRDVDLFTNGRLSPSVILHNRGASGIDGNTSTAAGMSCVSESESWMLTGDLAFLHDTTALLTLSGMRNNKLTICILNNGGGTIFRMLPVFEHKDVYTPFFETPQNVDIKSICAGFGVMHERIVNSNELEAKMAIRELEKSGVLILECITDPDESLLQRKKLWNQP